MAESYYSFSFSGLSTHQTAVSTQIGGATFSPIYPFILLFSIIIVLQENIEKEILEYIENKTTLLKCTVLHKTFLTYLYIHSEAIIKTKYLVQQENISKVIIFG